MLPHPTRVAGLCRPPAVAGLIAAVLSGCSAPRPDLRPHADAAAAVGLPEPIEFRTEAGPLDEPAMGETLTAPDALRRAAATHPELQAALARVRAAAAEADQARLLPNPLLGFVVRGGAGDPQIEVSLAQDLLSLLSTRRRASAADNRLREAGSTAVTAALDIALELQEGYIAVQAADALVPLLEARLELIGRLAGAARARLEAGEGTRTELTLLDAQRVELEVDLDAARLEQRQERIRLARLLGEPSSAAAWRLDPWTPPDIDASPESVWIDTALIRRPEVQAVVWRLASLGDEQALAGLLAWEGAGAGIDAQKDSDWSAGPSVSAPIPLFDSGQARRDLALAEAIEARHALTLIKRRVVEEVRIAHGTLAASRMNLDRIRNQLVPLQEQRRRVAEDLYRSERDILPVLLAEQDLRASQVKALEVERQACLALVRLHRAVGGPGVAAALSHPAQTPAESAPTVRTHDTDTAQNGGAR